MRPWISAGLLIFWLGSSARAAELTQDATEQWAYPLAAAAQPGTPASDWLLARTFEMQLEWPAEAGAPKLPADFTLRLAAERDRLTGSADRALMDDPVQLSMRIFRCTEEKLDESACRARRTRLAELDGDNAATAVALMGAAWLARDNAGFLEAAARGAKASRHEPAFLSAFGQLRERYAAVPDVAAPGTPLRSEGVDRADAAAISSAAAWALPAYQLFGQPCREAEGELLGHCLAIARQMVRSGRTTIDVMIGASLLTSHGSVEDQAEASDRRREADWLLARSAELMSGTTEHALPGLSAFFDVFVTDGELAAQRALLRANGGPVLPPEDWLSPERSGAP
jgi:hypothetical protein